MGWVPSNIVTHWNRTASVKFVTMGRLLPPPPPPKICASYLKLVNFIPGVNHSVEYWNPPLLTLFKMWELQNNNQIIALDKKNFFLDFRCV